MSQSFNLPQLNTCYETQQPLAPVVQQPFQAFQPPTMQHPYYDNTQQQPLFGTVNFMPGRASNNVPVIGSSDCNENDSIIPIVSSNDCPMDHMDHMNNMNHLNNNMNNMNQMDNNMACSVNDQPSIPHWDSSEYQQFNPCSDALPPSLSFQQNLSNFSDLKNDKPDYSLFDQQCPSAGNNMYFPQQTDVSDTRYYSAVEMPNTDEASKYAYDCHGNVIGILDNRLNVMSSRGIEYTMIRPINSIPMNYNRSRQNMQMQMHNNNNNNNNNNNTNNNANNINPVVVDTSTNSTDTHTLTNEDQKQVVIPQQTVPLKTSEMRTITKSTMKRGRHIDKSEKPFVCKVCGKGYKYLCNYRSHCKIHTDDAFVCQYCNKRFGRKSNFKEHVRIHTGESPYKCQFCSRTFKQHHGWKDHLRVHTGEKPYLCKVCGKRFTVGHNLNVHMRIHTGERPYHCEICKKSYRQKSAYNSHIKNVHGLKIQKKNPTQIVHSKNKERIDQRSDTKRNW